MFFTNKLCNSLFSTRYLGFMVQGVLVTLQLERTAGYRNVAQSWGPLYSKLCTDPVFLAANSC